MGRRHDRKIGNRGRNRPVDDVGLAEQHFVGRDFPVLAVDAKPGAGIALRIEIDDQNPLADRGKRGRQVDGGGGLADPALLVGYRDHAATVRHGWFPGLLGFTETALRPGSQIREFENHRFRVDPALM